MQFLKLVFEVVIKDPFISHNYDLDMIIGKNGEPQFIRVYK